MDTKGNQKKQGSNNTDFGKLKQLRWVYFLFFAFLLFLWFGNRNQMTEVTWDRFEENMLAKGNVEKVNIVNGEKVEIYLKPEVLDQEAYQDLLKNSSSKGPHCFFNIGSVEIFHEQLQKIQKDIPRSEWVSVTYSKENDWGSSIFSWLLTLGLIFFIWIFLFGRMGGGLGRGSGSMFSFGKTQAREFEKGKTQVSFADVAGIEEAKEELYELVRFLKDPSQYKRLGAKMPKGVLLVGPPGTGKTLLAKAVAGEAGVPFFSLSGSEFIEMFVGVGAARVRDLFQKAKAKAPSIIFIDEIDTIGRARGSASAFQANDERESTLNQLLATLDGFDSSTGVIVLAATNRGDILDPALLRPGRFDRHIHLELPSLPEREAIFKVHIKPLAVANDVNIEMLAAQTPGFSGADIANICNEAALIAARNKTDEVRFKDFMNAIDRVIGGLEKKSKIISPEEKRRIAYHEAGHVTASWYLEKAATVLKVSIIPRGKSLGAAWFLPEERQIITQSQLMDTICAALGGRAAEDIVYDEVSSNALDDLEKVTKLAYSMVANYGLSDKIRNLSYYDSTGQMQQAIQKPYSEKTAQIIDAEAQRIVDEAYKKTKAIIKKHRDKLDQLAQALIENEIVLKEEISEIFSKSESTKEGAEETQGKLPVNLESNGPA